MVLTDGDPAWRPDGYRSELLGTELALRFPAVKTLDYDDRGHRKEDVQELFRFTDPFS